MEERDPLTRDIIGAAIAVSRGLGAGLLESVYEMCLAHELRKLSLEVRRQPSLPVVYDGVRFKAAFRPDLIVGQTVIIEVKAAAAVLPIHEAQLLTYMRLSGMPKGLLINFNAFPFAKGIKRMVL